MPNDEKNEDLIEQFDLLKNALEEQTKKTTLAEAEIKNFKESIVSFEKQISEKDAALSEITKKYNVELEANKRVAEMFNVANNSKREKQKNLQDYTEKLKSWKNKNKEDKR